MKVMTVVGTRPEIIRLSRVISRLDRSCDHVLVHTGQNYDHQLNQVFFDDLGLRPPDHLLGVDPSSLGSVLAGTLTGVERVIREEGPDAFLVLGDTNSCIGAVMAKRMRVPVYHMEAGNRCFDENVPEETNRRLVDHVADFNLAYTEHARRNLLAEGLHPRRVIVTGSPMREVLEHYRTQIDESDVLERLGLAPRGYFLVSAHREENVDAPDRLRCLLASLRRVHERWKLPVIVSTHPRTRKRLEAIGHEETPGIRFLEPFGFHDYNHLQLAAACVLSDSGTIAEESAILGFPAVTLRDSIERPEALDTGSILMSGLDPDDVELTVTAAMADRHEASVDAAGIRDRRHQPPRRPLHDVDLRAAPPVGGPAPAGDPSRTWRGSALMSMPEVPADAPIPFALPDITDAEVDAVTEVLRSRWLTTGARTREFEQRFAEAVGSPHAVALNSCTAALHLSLEALGVQPGDHVYVPTYTFASSAEVVRYLDAVPVLVDVDGSSSNLDPEALRAAIARSVREGARPAAVIPVHISGVACDLDEIWQIAREHDLAVVEDAAHAFPASFRGRTIGSMPDDVRGTVCFSFYATKTITTGEGGMVTTQDQALADRIRVMSLHGLSREAWNRYTGGTWRYDIVAPGYKYNLTDMASALGIVQLARADEMTKRRTEIAGAYQRGLADLAGLQLPTVPDDRVSSWHLYMLRLAPGASEDERDRLIDGLKATGVGTSMHFIPLHLHSYYAQTFGYVPEDFPVALDNFRRGLSLPIYSTMTDSEVDRVIAAVRTLVSTG